MDPVQPKEERAWLFDRGAWSDVDEGVYSLAHRGDASDLSSAFRLAGYREQPIMQLGSMEKGFSVEVYEAANGPNVPVARTPYFVTVMIGSAVECIYVPDFPSFVMMINQLSAIAGSLLLEDNEDAQE